MFVKDVDEMKYDVTNSEVVDELFNGMLDCISILSSHERDKLEEIVEELKQSDGEH